MTLVSTHSARDMRKKAFFSPAFHARVGGGALWLTLRCENNRVLSLVLLYMHLAVIMLTDATISEFLCDFCRYVRLSTRNAVRWQILKSMY